jgi:quercetin dioxygenase-like cupin family protein
MNATKLRGFCLLSLGAMLATSVFIVKSFGAGAFPQIIPIAAGTDMDADLKAKVKGPTDVLTAELVFESGGDTGWHIHPGPVAVVIKSGSLTEYHANGCSSFHPAGSAFLEDANVVHRAVSEQGPSEVFVTFISPKGIPALIPVGDPGPATCKK